MKKILLSAIFWFLAGCVLYFKTNLPFIFKDVASLLLLGAGVVNFFADFSRIKEYHKEDIL